MGALNPNPDTRNGPTEAKGEPAPHVPTEAYEQQANRTTIKEEA
jgi:hypothetical protein